MSNFLGTPEDWEGRSEKVPSEEQLPECVKNHPATQMLRFAENIERYGRIIEDNQQLDKDQGEL